MLKTKPNHGPATVLLADLMAEAKGETAALELLQTALAGGGGAEIRHGLAKRLFARQNHLAALQEAIGQPDFNTEMYELTGRCLERLERFPEAAAAYDLGGKLDPGYPSIFMHRALLAQQAEKADPRPYLLQALQADPDQDYALAHFLWASLARCDWDIYDKL